jgi:hypothetical protein
MSFYVRTVSVVAQSRKMHRTSIGSLEKGIGALIVILLIAVGGTIAIKGQRYDPSRYTGDADALEFTREAVTGIAATMGAEGDLGEGSTIEGPSTVSASAGEILPFISGLEAMGPTERYNADTLYEKINGRAPAYLEYNFQELTCRSFSVSSAAGEYIDVYLFKMDSPLNAFGIFSAERDSSGTQLEFVSDGYASEMGYFLRQGKVYMQTLASSTSPAVMKMAKSFTAALAQAIPSDDSGMEGKASLPAENQIPGSLVFINDNAYGQASLSAVFESRYLFNGVELTYFAKSCGDTTQAVTIWNEIKNFYGRYGSGMETQDIEGIQVFSADMFGQWVTIYVKDNLVAGIINAPDQEAAQAFVAGQLESASREEDLEEYGF